MKTMFVRYLGSKICWTVEDGRFYIGAVEEATAEELAACEKGGDDLPLSFPIDIVAR